MLSKILISLDKRVVNLSLSLESFMQALTQSSPDPAIGQTCLMQVQQAINEELLAIAVDELPLPLAKHWLSLQTEIHRSLKLVVTDYYFWQTALKSKRPFQHQARLEENLQRLQSYLCAIQSLIQKCPLESKES